MIQRSDAALQTAPAFDAEMARADFPILSKPVYGKRLVFLDSGASAQKPRAVLDAMSHLYEDHYANIHRGVYYLSQKATEDYEAAREKIRGFVNAPSMREIVFVRGATEAINLVAQTWGRAFLRAGDEVILSHMEHHSNIVPWQMLRDQIGIVLRVAPITTDGALDMDAYRALLSQRVKLVAMTHVSNALGSITPIKEIVRLAHEAGAKILVDGCQAAPHMPINVQDMGCDFYVFSGHKLYGPTGIGVLYGREELLEAMPPYQGGGDMINSVTFEKTVFAELPFKFEAGTPHIAGAVGLGAAVDYVSGLGLEAIAAHENELLRQASERLGEIEGVRLIGTARDKAAILSFEIGGVHPHDVGTILDQQGIAVRAGHHCAQPVMDFFGVPATTRASFGLYNTLDDVEALAAGVRTVQEIFG